MATYPFTQNIPLETGWDVVVVGGGPAGCTAAVAAAREGAKTLLLEQTQSLGGSGTTALVPAWCPFSDQKQIIYRGLGEKIFRASQLGTPHVPATQLDWVAINPEYLKRIYDDLVTEAGVTVRFQTSLAAVQTDSEGSVDALIISNKSGLQALRAKVYIDCSGDGDLAAWAGAEFQKGDETAGEMQPGTLCFVLSNVNEAAIVQTPQWSEKVHLAMRQILNSGKYPEIPDTHLCHNKLGSGTYGFNAGHLFHVDNTDPDNLSKAAMQGRKMADALQRALAEFLPEAFGNAFLVTTGAQVGIRETRRIVGDYVLNLDDYLNRRTFADEICRNAYPIDIHTTAAEAQDKKEVNAMHRFPNYGPGESHGIPYRCLTPKGLRNLLVAGRNISCDRPVHASIRVMPVCLAMGEAAGLAAALAAQAQTPDVHAVNTARLRDRLRAEGAYLP